MADVSVLVRQNFYIDRVVIVVRNVVRVVRRISYVDLSRRLYLSQTKLEFLSSQASFQRFPGLANFIFVTFHTISPRKLCFTVRTRELSNGTSFLILCTEFKGTGSCAVFGGFWWFLAVFGGFWWVVQS